MSVLLMNACEQTSNTTINEPISEPPTENSSVTNTNSTSATGKTITGVATIGLFSGTEKSCVLEDTTFGELACNTGSGTIYLETSDGKVYLKDHSCSATQFYVNDETGKHVEYRASAECDEGIIIGESYLATGDLTLEEDVWRNGKQVDEQWLTVTSIVLAK